MRASKIQGYRKSPLAVAAESRTIAPSGELWSHAIVRDDQVVGWAVNVPRADDYQLGDVAVEVATSRILVLVNNEGTSSRWLECALADVPLRVAMTKMTAPYRALHELILWCRQHRKCSTALFIRDFLICLHGSQQLVDVARVGSLEPAMKGQLLCLLGAYGIEVPDIAMEQAIRRCDMQAWWDESFKD